MIALFKNVNNSGKLPIGNEFFLLLTIHCNCRSHRRHVNKFRFKICLFYSIFSQIKTKH